MFFLIITFIALLATVIILNYSMGAEKSCPEPKFLPPFKNPVVTGTAENDCNPMLQPPSFFPSEAKIVPSHASYSNKFNDVIGNEKSGIVGAAADPELIIPSDWYMSSTLPTEFDGKYWPKGSIEYDFIYPGSDPDRPLRPQTLYSSQILSFGS
jgi:hypothetical protein